MRQELMNLSSAAQFPLRTEAGARTDAYSAAVVAARRERNDGPVPRAWFIAQDRLTNKAYGVIRPDDRFPVSSTVEAWLLLLSVARRDDPAWTRNIAEIVGDVVIFNSFLAVSTSYGVDELTEIAELLQTAPSKDAEELAETVRADYLALAASEGTDLPAELLRRRAMRRDRQVQRKAEQVEAAQEG